MWQQQQQHPGSSPIGCGWTAGQSSVRVRDAARRTATVAWGCHRCWKGRRAWPMAGTRAMIPSQANGQKNIKCMPDRAPGNLYGRSTIMPDFCPGNLHQKLCPQAESGDFGYTIWQNTVSNRPATSPRPAAIHCDFRGRNNVAPPENMHDY